MLNPLPLNTAYARKQYLSLATQKAHRTLKRLCKHFQHKVEVQWNLDNAVIYFEEGNCTINANEERLKMCCEADSQSDLLAITDTMDRHITGFCQDEIFAMKWCEQP